MAFDHKDVIQAQYQQIAADRAAAVGSYESSRLNEDSDGTMSAANAIIEADARLAALNRIANNLTAGSRQAPLAGEDEMSRSDAALARHYGLTGTQLAVAKGWTSDNRMSDEAKVRTYIENTNRYRQARASGQYRDDQGSIRR